MTDASSPVSLAAHRQAEFGLVADLQRLGALADSFGSQQWKERIEDAQTRIADHHFSIAVVGEFKRGKSTLINALLGKEILPADVVPTSATINRVSYGLKPFVEILFRDGREKRMIDIGQLAEYVTKLTPEARTIAATVAEAVVHYPVPFCRQNIDIIDTPGLSDEAATTEVTLGILPRVDAAILVTLATSPFSQSEANFLEQLLLDYGLESVVFVVTGMDKVRSAADQERVLGEVAGRIQDCIKRSATRFGEGSAAYEEYIRRIGAPRVFAVSGYNALAGKVDGDHQLVEESKIPEFERFLEQFLAEESGLVALKGHAQRIVGFACGL
jgi:GTPase SAR1 family protein